MVDVIPNRLKKIYTSTQFSFGSTSAIITNAAIIIGLDAVSNARPAIIGGLLVVAVADNISDSLGIHIYQESEGKSERQAWLQTFTNFFSRLIISLGFILIISIFPLSTAVAASLVYGLVVLSVVSYLIAVRRGTNPWFSIGEHLAIAVFVIFLSKYAGQFITDKFR